MDLQSILDYLEINEIKFKNQIKQEFIGKNMKTISVVSVFDEHYSVQGRYFVIEGIRNSISFCEIFTNFEIALTKYKELSIQ